MSFFDTNATEDVTLHGLEKWTCYLYENLGWMTLANETNKDKVSAYLISIKKLTLSIDKRLNTITNEDAKVDLETLKRKIIHLNNISKKLFDLTKIKKNICQKCNLSNESGNVKLINKNSKKTKKKFIFNKIPITKKSISNKKFSLNILKQTKNNNLNI